MKTSRKTVLCIVEGITDQVALGASLAAFFFNDDVRFHIVHGDITTTVGVNSRNIITKIASFAKGEMALYNLRPKDIKQIIHIVDMDGAFINDDCIQQGDSDAVRYLPDAIITVNPDSIRKRNLLKRDNILRLIRCRMIMDIPYSIYFMACNLDHVICDNPNATRKEKIEAASRFEMKYAENLSGFIEFFISQLPSELTYAESWNFIQKDCNSLGRYSNLKFVFRS